MIFLVLNIGGFVEFHTVYIPVNNRLTAKINLPKTFSVIEPSCVVDSAQRLNKNINLDFSLKCLYGHGETFLEKRLAFEFCPVINVFEFAVYVDVGNIVNTESVEFRIVVEAFKGCTVKNKTAVLSVMLHIFGAYGFLVG